MLNSRDPKLLAVAGCWDPVVQPLAEAQTCNFDYTSAGTLKQAAGGLTGKKNRGLAKFSIQKERKMP